MAIEISNEENCSGCEACANICPTKCIKMISDKKGFIYPYVEHEKCVDCNLCIDSCPIQNRRGRGIDESNIDVYAGWSKNQEIRYSSTSGGLFSELAYLIIQNGGYVAGAAYNQQNDVEHIIVSDDEGLEKIRQSKYTQSLINDVFTRIKTLLLEDKEVLFCGTPCQVAGLKKFLGEDFAKLITIDFICRGVNSPKAYRAWLSEIENLHQKKIVKVWFKYKINGWKNSPQCTRIDFENGTSCIQNSYKNTYMRGYLGANLYIRPSCGKCQYKSIARDSDITLADFWGIAKELDDDLGTSLIIVNSVKGKELFEKCKKHIFYEERTLSEIMEGNACFKSSVKINSRSEEFLSKLDDKQFSKLVEEYAKIPLIRRVKIIIKKEIKKLFKE